MNEMIFAGHLLLVLGCTLGALRMGKGALVTWIALGGVMANLFVMKQMELLGLVVTCSDVYMIGSTLGLNLLQEFFGKEEARKTIWITFGAMIVFALMAQVHLFYLPSQFDGADGAYRTILSVAPRIIVASLTAYFLVQQIDVRLFGFLKRRFERLPLGVRSAICLIICQVIDTVLFAYMGLWGVIASIGSVILAGCAVKIVCIGIMTPFANLGRRVVREV